MTSVDLMEILYQKIVDDTLYKTYKQAQRILDNKYTGYYLKYGTEGIAICNAASEEVAETILVD